MDTGNAATARKRLSSDDHADYIYWYNVAATTGNKDTYAMAMNCVAAILEKY
jgi:hypothetical protein